MQLIQPDENQAFMHMCQVAVWPQKGKANKRSLTPAQQKRTGCHCM